MYRKKRIIHELKHFNDRILHDCKFDDLYNTMIIRFLKFTFTDYPFNPPICYINIDGVKNNLMNSICNIPTDIWSWRLITLIYPDYKTYVTSYDICVCCMSCLCKNNWNLTIHLNDVVKECLLFATISKMKHVDIYQGGQYLKRLFNVFPDEIVMHIVNLSYH